MLFELENSIKWRLEPVNQAKEAKAFKLVQQKFNMLASKNKLKSTLTFNNEKLESSTNANQNQLKMDIVGNFYEFYVCLDTKEVNIYQELFHSPIANELQPVSIRSSLSIYFCPQSSINLNIDSSTACTPCPTGKNYLLQIIEVNFVLGFGRIRTSGHIESIDFEIYKEHMSTSVKSKHGDENNFLKGDKKTKCSKDVDRTLTSFSGEDSYFMRKDIEKKKSDQCDLEMIIPLSNPGNIEIEVGCYLKCLANTFLEEIIFKEGYELKLCDSLLTLEAKSRSKSYVRLVLTKNGAKANEAEISIKNSRVKLIFQIKPNGCRSEIPVSFLFEPPSNATPLGCISTNSFVEEPTYLVSTR